MFSKLKYMLCICSWHVSQPDIESICSICLWGIGSLALVHWVVMWVLYQKCSQDIGQSFFVSVYVSWLWMLCNLSMQYDSNKNNIRCSKNDVLDRLIDHLYNVLQNTYLYVSNRHIYGSYSYPTIVTLGNNCQPT